MMRRLRWIAPLAVLALAASGIAAASHFDSQLKTDSVAADATAERVYVAERTCTGVDGEYRHAREYYVGTAESGDPRLAGEIGIKLRSRVQTTGDTAAGEVVGYGAAEGTVWLRDPETHELKLRARLLGVVSPTGVLNGMIVGHVPGQGYAFLNFSGTVAPPDSAGKVMLKLELGEQSPAELTPLNSAVIQTGRCPRGEAFGHWRGPNGGELKELFRPQGEGRGGGKDKGHDD